MGSYGPILGKLCQQISNKFCELGQFWSHSSISNGNPPVLTCGACSCRHRQAVEPKHDTLSPDSVEIWAILWRPGTRYCAEIQVNLRFLGKPPIGIVPRHHIQLDKVMRGWVSQKIWTCFMYNTFNNGTGKDGEIHFHPFSFVSGAFIESIIRQNRWIAIGFAAMWPKLSKFAKIIWKLLAKLAQNWPIWPHVFLSDSF